MISMLSLCTSLIYALNMFFFWLALKCYSLKLSWENWCGWFFSYLMLSEIGLKQSRIMSGWFELKMYSDLDFKSAIFNQPTKEEDAVKHCKYWLRIIMILTWNLLLWTVLCECEFWLNNVCVFFTIKCH